ncbi:MFS transporter [Quadrisphaera setariae]|uniref:MFS transporter n=1 Tax=Quadrisphaera setariae TaxID=2593304 RepID=A0A5C8ZJU5_9ACTN|nr:MFS transporter [Quadrisphaera setariae]TXR57894.1 MFS transporter [Quadrisphaera setariae]
MTSHAGSPARGVAVYGAVLRRPGALVTFAASVLARLPIAMAPLGMVLLVERTSGSYATAGAVTAAFAVGTAAGAPVWGRAMDVRAQARVLAPTVTASAGLLVVLALAAQAGAHAAVLCGVALGAGMAFPPFSAAMRASWRVLLGDPVHRRAGFALDAAAVEALFVLGPLLLSGLLVALPTTGPLLVTAAVLLVGGLAYAATGPARLGPRERTATAGASTTTSTADAATAEPAPSATAPTATAPAQDASAQDASAPAGPGPTALLTSAPLLAVLATGLAMALAFGATDTSLAATARTVLGDDAALGLLFAAIAGGSTLGGLTYGAVAGHHTGARLLPLTLGVFGAGLGVVSLVLAAPGGPSTPLLLAVLFVVGLVIAPSLIIQQALVDAQAPLGRTTEAQAWLSTAVTTGGALGTAAGGAVIEAAGVAAAFGSAAGALGLAVLVALVSQGSWQRAGAGPSHP